MGKNGKIVVKFLERLSQTGSVIDALSMELEDEDGCSRDQAVLVTRGCMQLSKYVKTSDEYVNFLKRSAKDRTEEVKGWLDDWKFLKGKMDESYRYMRGIVWKVEECSYKGSEYYHECLDEISATLVERAGENVKAFGKLKKSAEDLMREAMGMMGVWKKMEEERRMDDEDVEEPEEVAELPEELQGEKKEAMLKRFVEEGLLTDDYMPSEDLSRTQKAVLADRLAELMDIKDKWKFFESFWGLRALATALTKGLEQKNMAEFMKRIKKVQ